MIPHHDSDIISCKCGGEPVACMKCNALFLSGHAPKHECITSPMPRPAEIWRPDGDGACVRVVQVAEDGVLFSVESRTRSLERLRTLAFLHRYRPVITIGSKWRYSGRADGVAVVTFRENGGIQAEYDDATHYFDSAEDFLIHMVPGVVKAEGDAP